MSITHRQGLGIALFCLFCLQFVWPLQSNAQIIIDPPPTDPSLPIPAPIAQVQIELYQVDITVDGPLIETHLTQILRNDSRHAIEGQYIFPLPTDAAIGDFQMTVNGEVIEGEILRRDEARQTYAEIVRQRRDPALLEYLGRDLFQVNVFPIPAGESRTLELAYSQLLSADNGLYRLSYPLETRHLTSTPVGMMKLHVALVNQPGLRTIYSPNFAIETNRQDEKSAEISFQATDYQPQGDFALYFGSNESAIGLNLLSYNPAGEDGYFVLLAAPSVAQQAEAIVQRDIVMVVDVSGSMSGAKMEQAKAAMHYVVDQLHPDDRFNLIAFSTGVRLWQPTLHELTPSAQEAAHLWIDRLNATGSTDINRALLEAVAQIQENSAQETTRPAYILFLTDGLPTQGERDSNRIIANILNNGATEQSIRLFNFGVGYDVNTTLLDTLSSELRGRSRYVRPNERIDEEVSTFYQGISVPVLSDVQIELALSTANSSAGENRGVADATTVTVDELYPYPLPDLFAGEQLVLAGRYHFAELPTNAQQVIVDVTLQGSLNGKSLIYHYPDQHLVTAGGEATLARLWASRKIGAMLYEIRRHGPTDELIDAIIELSMQYGIVTPYTSSFVPEPGVVSSNDEIGRGQPLAADLYDANEESDSAFSPEGSQAAKEGRDAIAATAMTASVGEAAVTLSEQITDLRTNANVAQNAAMVYVAGRAFYAETITQEGQDRTEIRWVDSSYDKTKALVTIEFGSPCYFSFVEEIAMSEQAVAASLAEWIAVGSELILTIDETHALLITAENHGASTTHSCPADEILAPLFR